MKSLMRIDGSPGVSGTEFEPLKLKDDEFFDFPYTYPALELVNGYWCILISDKMRFQMSNADFLDAYRLFGKFKKKYNIKD